MSTEQEKEKQIEALVNQETNYNELPEEHPDHLSKDSQFIAEHLFKFFGLIHLNNEQDMKEHLDSIDEFTEDEKYGTARKMSKEEFLNFLDRIIFWKTFISLKHNVDNIFIDEYAENANDEKIINLLGMRNIVTSYNDKLKQWQGFSNLNGGMIINLDNNRATCAMRTLLSTITGTFYNEVSLANKLTKHWMEVKGINIDPRDRTYEELDEIAKECGTSIEEIEKDYQERLEKLQGTYEETQLTFNDLDNSDNSNSSN